MLQEFYVSVTRKVPNPFWDAVIIRGAAQLGCGIAWSEDLNAGQVYQEVPVVKPFVTRPDAFAWPAMVARALAVRHASGRRAAMTGPAVPAVAPGRAH